jgi:hypothetical protein
MSEASNIPKPHDGGSDQRLVRRWPVHGEACVIWHRGTHLWATWYDGEGLAGGPGAWIYTHNGSFVAFHDQVQRWWSLTDAAAIHPPNIQPGGR